jgi:hypothetical protein
VRTFVGGIRGVILKVIRVNLHFDGVGAEELVSVEIMDDEGREGIIQGDLIHAIEKIPGQEPSWYAELMEHDGPRD